MAVLSISAVHMLGIRRDGRKKARRLSTVGIIALCPVDSLLMLLRSKIISAPLPKVKEEQQADGFHPSRELEALCGVRIGIYFA